MQCLMSSIAVPTVLKAHLNILKAFHLLLRSFKLQDFFFPNFESEEFSQFSID